MQWVIFFLIKGGDVWANFKIRSYRMRIVGTVEIEAEASDLVR